ncbi:MAG TPA: DUF262 domain-containing protein [Chloroflexia bacterium]|jgi:hypothetical protein
MVTEISIVEQAFEIEGNDDMQQLLAIPQDKRALRTQSSDPEIDSLYNKWKRGKLLLQPDFQRHFVWNRTKASRLIESVLLSVPLPIIYLAEEEDGRQSVIDGQQRLTSFFSFIDGKLPDGEVFRLTGLTAFPDLIGKTFLEMDEKFQDKIRFYEIRAVTILNDSDPDLKFEIFERLNTGAEPLNDMELRNCIYRGRYMGLLKELASDPEFIQVIGFKEPDNRMRDVEMVLRFAAFYQATYLKYQPPMKRFFNQDMERHQHISKADEEQLRKAFRNAVALTKSMFGEHAFKRFYRGNETNPRGYWEPKKINASLYDVLMGVFAELDKNQVYAALDAIREGIIDLMVSSDEFIDAITLGTSEQIRVRKRFDLVRKTVEDVLSNYQKQPRCFSLQLKRELFEQDPTCTICEQQISQLDDAAVDHIQQYWKGGKTIPDNARLTHRYCNNARSRTD